jgi:peroxiredoxin
MKLLLLSLLFLFFGMTVFAQPDTEETLKFPTKQSIIRDSTGKQYSYDELMKMMRTGEYTIAREEKMANTDFLVRPVTAAEKEARIKLLHGGNDIIKTGMPLPVFSLADLEGKQYQLAELKGKVVVLNFWFIGCSPCRKEIPELNALAEKYAGRDDIVFLAIALDKKEQLQQFLQQHPFKYAIVAEGKKASVQYDINGYPTNLVVDKEGIVRFYHTGYGNGTISDLGRSVKKYLKRS